MEENLSEKQFRLLFDNACGAMFVLDHDVIADCNGSMAAAFHCARERLLGCRAKDISPARQPDGSSSADRVQIHIEHALTGSREQYRWRHRRPDGSIFDSTVSLTHISANGKRYLLAELMDVSDDCRQDDCGGDHSDIVDNISDCVWKLTLKAGVASPSSLDDFSISAVNRSIERLLGYRVDDFIGKSIRDILTQNAYEFTNRLFSEEFLHPSSASAVDDRDVTACIQQVHRNGSLVDTEVCVRVLRDATGGVAGLQGITRDITARVAAEKALLESKKKYRDLAEQLPVMIFEVDPLLNIAFINRHILNAFGDILFDQDSRLNYREIVAPDEVPLFEECLERVRAGEEVRNIIMHGITYRGTRMPIDLTLEPVLVDGAVTAIRGIGMDITEQQEREIALRQSEERYRTIIENIMDGYYEVDLRGSLTFFNDALVSMLGFTREELRDMNYRSYTSPEYLERIFHDFNKVYRSGVPIDTLTWEIVRKDGSKRLLEMSVSPTRNRDGIVTGFRGIVRDATERTRLLDLIRESEERYRTIIKNIEDGYYELDLRGNVTFFNESFRQILGYSYDETMGLHYRRYLDQSTAERVYREYHAVYRTGMAKKNLEYDIIRKDGRRRTVEVSVTPITGAGGELNGFRGIMRDITERKREQEALRISEERYRTIIENIADVYYESDLKGCLTFVNDQGLALFNASRGEIIGSYFSDFSDPKCAKTLYEAAATVLMTGIPCSGIDWEITRKDGSTITGNLSISLVRDENGTAIGYRGILRDTTERKRAEDMIKVLAYHDMLTGLPNRALLNDRLAMSINYAIRYNRKLAVLLFDLDGFKEVNDTYGHQVGDLLLQKVSNRLMVLMRKSDTIARLGGDEFIVLLNDIGHAEDAESFATKIIDSFSLPFTCNALDIRTGASIGIALYPDHGDTIDELIRKSDEAMYRAKRAGAGRYLLYR